MITLVSFEAYGRPLETLMVLKYLRRVLTASYYNLPVVVANLRKARNRWTWTLQILRREGVYPWNSGKFYKAVVQATLLFGAETWVLSPSIGRTLARLYHSMVQRLTGM